MADNDNITDLAGEGDSGGAETGEQGKTQKAAKAKKAPQAPKDMPPAPAPQAVAKKKKKKGRKLKIILILVLVVLVVGFVAEEIIFNYLGVRDMFIDAVISLDPEYGEREQRYVDWEADLTARESEMSRREQAVQSRQGQNERRTIELNLMEEELKEQQQSLTPLWRRVMSEQELADMQSLSRSYALMAPETAAERLVQLEDMEDVAAIMYYMVERNAAAILAAMEPEYAAALTEILLYK